MIWGWIKNTAHILGGFGLVGVLQAHDAEMRVAHRTAPSECAAQGGIRFTVGQDTDWCWSRVDQHVEPGTTGTATGTQ